MAITFDNSTNSALSGGSGTSQSFTILVGTGSNRLLIVVVGSNLNTLNPVTAGGLNMTQIGGYVQDSVNLFYTSMWYLLNPPSGTISVVVSDGSSVTVYADAASYAGVAQQAPEATNSGTTSSLSVTTIANNAMPIICIGGNAASPTGGAGTTARSINSTGGWIIGDSGTPKTPPGSVTLAISSGASAFAGLIASFAPFVILPAFIAGKGFRPYRNTRGGILSTAVFPDVPQPLYPFDGQQSVGDNPILRWFSHGATSYDIAFGTSPSPPTVVTGQVSPTYTPTVVAGVTYYWQIVAHNAIGSATGAVWSFTLDSVPDPIDVNNTTCLNYPPLTYSTDRNQLRNKIIVVGASGSAAASVANGASLLPVNAPFSTLSPPPNVQFSPTGGWAKSGAQYFSYASAATSYAFNLSSWATISGLNGSTNLVNSNNGIFIPELGLGFHICTSQVLVSYDGYTWTAYALPGYSGSNSFWSSAWSPTLGIAIILDLSNGTNRVQTSTDGVHWTDHALPSIGSEWLDACWSPALGIFAAVGNGSGGSAANVMASSNGVTWNLSTFVGSSLTHLNNIVWADTLNKFVISTDGSGVSSSIYASTDIVNFFPSTSAPPTASGLAWSSSLGVLCTFSGATPYVSSDGNNWAAGQTLAVTGWNNVQWLAGPGLFVATRNAASGVNVATSPDGRFWTTFTANFAFGGVNDIVFNSVTGVLNIAGNVNGGSTPFMTVSTAIIGVNLTGIPSSGTGAIQYGINDGDEVSLVSIRQDLVAQAQAASVEGGDGVHEFPMSDGNLLTPMMANNAGDAELSLFAYPITSIQYSTRDPKTSVGKFVHVDRPDLGILGDFLIQSVSITNIGTEPGTFPVYAVKAASVKFTFVDALRTFLLPGG